MIKNSISNQQLAINHLAAFTFIELLFTVTIVAVISALSLARYNDFTERKRLEGDAKQLVDVLNLARKKSMASDMYSDCADFKGYKVDIGINSYTLFFLCGNSESPIQTYNFSPNNKIASGTSGEVIFIPIDGTINGNPTFTLRNTFINKAIDINIYRTGVIDLGDINPYVP